MDLVWPFMECAREVAFLLMILVYVSSPRSTNKNKGGGKRKGKVTKEGSARKNIRKSESQNYRDRRGKQRKAPTTRNSG